MKIVDVQQHFNDLELRIRNFALILTGAVLGLGGYAIKDAGMVHVAGYQITVASLIVSSSLIPLAAFYLMDRFWYHRLLDGAVKAGAEAEGRLREIGLKVDLGGQISRSSPFNLFWRFPVHSKHKMDGFYFLIALALIGISIALAKAEPLRPSAEAPQIATASNNSPEALPAPRPAKKQGSAE
jgi:hypothetical protein